ncbi:Histidyl-tRNA synthetase [Hordeum vulgare]|nr:Histidyl-tRNA synthetase [Hordeum vulgare]
MALADASGADHLRRPRNSHKVIESTSAMEEQVFLLQQHAVVLTVVNKLHTASPLSVGRALEKELKIPPHLLRVTSHDPEDFLVYFNLPAHKDLVARRGTISVDGNTYLAESWREDADALHQSWMMHVHVVLEKLPMQLWKLEGANVALGDEVIIDRFDSRTFERIYTKLFAVWVGYGAGPYHHSLDTLEGC